MTLQEAIKILEQYQAWRKGAEIGPLTPKEISEALNIAIHLMKGLNK